jgi:hypothetical protein
MSELVRVAGARRTIEETYQTAKNEAGPDLGRLPAAPGGLACRAGTGLVHVRARCRLLPERPAPSSAARADPAVVQPGTRLRLARAHAAASADTGLALDARVDVVSGIAPALDDRCAPVGRLHAVLAPEPLPELDPFADARIGVGTAGPAIEAARSWQAARTAPRFTGPLPSRAPNSSGACRWSPTGLPRSWLRSPT